MLERLAGRTGTTDLADEIISTLRYEKAVTKGNQDAVADVYHRISDYSSLDTPYEPEYTLLRDDRDGMPRRIVFDSVTVPTEYGDVQLVGREEPFRALRTHEFALGFDSADLVLEEVVQLRDEPLTAIHEINDRIDPLDTDVRVVTGLGDTVYHTLLATPEVMDSQDEPLDRTFVTNYEGELCISPRYERLVEAVLGTSALDGVSFTYPMEGGEEEADIAATGLGVYLTVTGSTARDHGLELGEQLFPSETVLLENAHERTETTEQVASLFEEPEETALQSI
ncbi:hypothetical protein GCM10022627_13370 [Haloarcula argentinensis]|uniref:Uncharacterized protein n=1 Tax=Haloarcula argentinensis TaxID=43776 RepID=A0A830FIJ6_HALAR|nr:hypothetical protein GCM10009006_06020 [Haloarcula argentinensis]